MLAQEFFFSIQVEADYFKGAEWERERKKKKKNTKTLEQVVVFSTWFSQEGSVVGILVFQISKEPQSSIKTWELESPDSKECRVE